MTEPMGPLEHPVPRTGCLFDGDDPWWAIAATQPRAFSGTTPSGQEGRTTTKAEDRLDRMLQVPHAKEEPPVLAPRELHPDHAADGEGFLPREPNSLREAGITANEIEALLLKYLLNRGSATGRDLSSQLKLPFRLIEGLLRQMKADLLVGYKASAPVGDYEYHLTDAGCERGRRYSEQSTYFGAAPVSLREYSASVEQQAISRLPLRMADLELAFRDLLINPALLSQLGQALTSGRGMFLYGAPGNGKSSIAERVTNAYGKPIWIPRSISVMGQIIRLFDPSNHEELPLAPPEELVDPRPVDHRWVRIRRPTIVAGGELTLDNLELILNVSTGISEAPLQMKSNCGTLVIDDFGRQRISPKELLNRWIVPLERRHDYLNLASGRKIEVPFEQLIIFSTNLQPRELVDEAFLRRIPYKIDVVDPSEDEFRDLFRRVARSMGLEPREDAISYVIDRHYKPVGRAYRFCHPRDLLLQVKNFCTFHERPFEMTPEGFDVAVKNYFALL